MRVVYKLPNEPAEVMEISNDLETLQTLVKGWIEPVKVSDEVCLIVNEEGKLHGMMPNFLLGDDLIVGPVIFTGNGGEDFTSLSEDALNVIMTYFGGVK